MSRIVSLARYLAVHWCSGDEAAVLAIRDYFVNGDRPSDIARRYGLSKNQVRGYVQRVLEKCGSFYVARALIRVLIPVITAVDKPFETINGGKMARCRLCGAEVLIDHFKLHLLRAHGKYLNLLAHRIVQSLLEEVVDRGRA